MFPSEVTAAFLSHYAYFCEDLAPPEFAAARPRAQGGPGATWERVSAPLSDWLLIENDVTDAEAICCRDIARGIDFVAFRGTESARDALADLRVTKSRLNCRRGAWGSSGTTPPSSGNPSPPGAPDCPPAPSPAVDSALFAAARVHTGFMQQFGSIAKDVVDYAGASPPCHALVLTGHSLGGALATLASLYLQLKLPGKEVRAHVFGSPRAGDASFARLMASLPFQVTRHELRNDPVPRLPNRLRWKHCGDSVVYTRRRRRRGRRQALATSQDRDPPQADSYEHDPGPPDGLFRGCLSIPNPFRVGAHGIDRYVAAVCDSFGTLATSENDLKII